MTAPVRISLRIPGTAPMPQLMKLIQDVEAAGFDGAGILDSQLLCRDTFATMALAATQTSRLTLFSAVTNPFTSTGWQKSPHSLRGEGTPLIGPFERFGHRCVKVRDERQDAGS